MNKQTRHYAKFINYAPSHPVQKVHTTLGAQGRCVCKRESIISVIRNIISLLAAPVLYISAKMCD